MKEQKFYSQIRIWRSTLKVLKFIHAETGESLLFIIDRLAKKEWEEIGGRNQNQS